MKKIKILITFIIYYLELTKLHLHQLSGRLSPYISTDNSTNHLAYVATYATNRSITRAVRQ